jgi:hypothetical protein
MDDNYKYLTIFYNKIRGERSEYVERYAVTLQ